MKHLRYGAPLLLLLLCGVAAVVLPGILARRNAQNPHIQIVSHPFPEPEDVPFFLVIGRRAEKSSVEDTIPHRNSLIALYKNTGDRWEKIEGDLPVRSCSTNERPPGPEDMPELGEPIRFGHQSVPTGIYTLKRGPWRYPGETGFLISDWGRFDGVISLSSPQVLRTARLVESTEGASVVIDREATRSTYEKKGSWLHMTATTSWSYQDSNGCINLYKPVGMKGIHPDAPPGPWDWDVMLGWLEKDQVPETEALPLGLYIYDLHRTETMLPGAIPFGFSLQRDSGNQALNHP